MERCPSVKIVHNYFPIIEFKDFKHSHVSLGSSKKQAEIIFCKVEEPRRQKVILV
jgi:hypothetical protein